MVVEEISPNPSSEPSDNESGNENLQGTGLLQNDGDSGFENNYDKASEQEQSIEQETQDLDNVNVKPPVLAKFKFAMDTIEISSD